MFMEITEAQWISLRTTSFIGQFIIRGRISFDFAQYHFCQEHILLKVC